MLAIGYRDAGLDKRMQDDIDQFLVRLADLRDSEDYLSVKKKAMLAWDLGLSERTASYLLAAASLYPFQSGLRNVCGQLMQAGIPLVDDQQTALLGPERLVRHEDQMVRRPVASLVTRQSLPLVAGIKAQALHPNSEVLAGATALRPIGRVAEPEELMGTCVYLASAASDYMTGQVVYVDGGRSCTA